jgi:hypothetical protein
MFMPLGLSTDCGKFFRHAFGLSQQVTACPLLISSKKYEILRYLFDLLLVTVKIKNAFDTGEKKKKKMS